MLRLVSLDRWCHREPPTLNGFDRLRNLRRLTLAKYGVGPLFVEEAIEGELRIQDLPPCLEVRATAPERDPCSLTGMHRSCFEGILMQRSHYMTLPCQLPCW